MGTAGGEVWPGGEEEIARRWCAPLLLIIRGRLVTPPANGSALFAVLYRPGRADPRRGGRRGARGWVGRSSGGRRLRAGRGLHRARRGQAAISPAGGRRPRDTRRDVRFFFQAEDGIRDLTVTGVQTCALPI